MKSNSVLTVGKVEKLEQFRKSMFKIKKKTDVGFKNNYIGKRSLFR